MEICYNEKKSAHNWLTIEVGDFLKTYLARQPIFDLNDQIFGYELLYRGNGGDNANLVNVDGDNATRAVLSDALTAFGLESITGGRIAFINFTRALLLGDLADYFSPQEFVIEILENTMVDQTLVDKIKACKSQGYRFAIDDYTGDEEFSVLLPLVDIVKVDFRLLTPPQRKTISAQLRKCSCRLLAEKVETEKEYVEARALGFSLFQGYYFARPMTLCTERTQLLQTTYVRLFQELARPELLYDQLAAIIRTDVNLTYRLLSHVNTLQYYRGHPVASIHTALLRMGTAHVRRWITLIFMRDFTKGGNEENMKTAFIRGLFTERIAARLEMAEDEGDDAFITGMFSMLDMVVNGELPALLKDLCVSDHVKKTLLGAPGPLLEILHMAKAYEDGDWEAVSAFADSCGLGTDQVVADYLESVKSAEQTFA